METNLQKGVETSQKIANCIQHMISRENILMVTQEGKSKNERYVALNVNIEMNTMRD